MIRLPFVNTRLYGFHINADNGRVLLCHDIHDPHPRDGFGGSVDTAALAQLRLLSIRDNMTANNQSFEKSELNVRVIRILMKIDGPNIVLKRMKRDMNEEKPNVISEYTQHISPGIP